MIQDNSLTFAQAQLIPQTQTTTEATNVIDTVVVNGGIQGATGNVGNGDAEPLNLNLVISTDQLAASATSAATLQFILYSGATDTATNTLYTSPAYTVAQLNAAWPPSAGLTGLRATVTDASTVTFLAALVGGGGVICPAFCNGTAWVAG